MGRGSVGAWSVGACLFCSYRLSRCRFDKRALLARPTRLHSDPLYTDKVSKCFRAWTWKGISGNGLRRIDSVKAVSILGYFVRSKREVVCGFNAEGTARQSEQLKRKRAEGQSKKLRQKDF